MKSVGRVKIPLLAPCLLAAASLCAGAHDGPARDASDGNSPDAVSRRRVVKVFDFDERKRGNLEDVPMLWFRKEAKGFPLHARSGFDEKQGYPSGPSFRLAPDGGSVAFEYMGKEIPVRPTSDYEVTAWVRTEGIVHARASITAFFLNRGGERIAGSERRSLSLCTTNGTGGWQQLRLSIPATFPDARFMGLSVAVEQPSVWWREARPPGYIERVDVTGYAWFDEITICRLPKASLTTPGPVPVFTPSQIPTLHAVVTDPDGEQLTATLQVKSADGQVVLDRPIDIAFPGRATPQPIKLETLQSGLYAAELRIASAAKPLSVQALQFVKLADRIRPSPRRTTGFGVVLSDDRTPDWRNEYAMLDAADVAHVKIPMWQSGMNTESRRPSEEQLDCLVQTLARDHVEMIGLFGQSPAPRTRDSDAPVQSLIELLNSDPQAWSPYLNLTLSRYATMLSTWQLGRDDEEELQWQGRLRSTSAILRKHMSVHVPHPILAVPWAVQHTLPDHAMGTEFLSVAIPQSLPAQAIPRHLQEIHKRQPKGLWAVVAPLSQTDYHRLARLGDLAKRLIYTAASGVSVVFLGQPWNNVHEFGSVRPDPTEDYLVLRTVADALHRSTLVGRINLDTQAECLIFDAAGQAVLAAWDDGADNHTRDHALPLGEVLEQVSIWGRRTTLAADGDNSVLPLGPTPVFVIGAKTWLAQLVGSVRLAPDRLETTFQPHTHRVEFLNTSNQRISGHFVLTTPTDWEATPAHMSFVLEPGERFSQEVVLRFPHSEPAGARTVLMRLDLTADRSYALRIPMAVHLGLEQIRVWSLTQVDEPSDRVIIRQEITNQSGRSVTLQSILIAPDSQPRRLMIPNVSPGETVVREYVLPEARNLHGRRVRIGLHDRQQSRLYNEEIMIP